jgi:hypothetical protein
MEFPELKCQAVIQICDAYGNVDLATDQAIAALVEQKMHKRHVQSWVDSIKTHTFKFGRTWHGDIPYIHSFDHSHHCQFWCQDCPTGKVEELYNWTVNQPNKTPEDIEKWFAIAHPNYVTATRKTVHLYSSV